VSSGFGQQRAIVSITEVFIVAAQIDDFDALFCVFCVVELLIPIHQVILWRHQLFNWIVGIPVLELLYDNNDFGHVPSGKCLTPNYLVKLFLP
jgi:hypothetical protein